MTKLETILDLVAKEIALSRLTGIPVPYPDFYVYHALKKLAAEKPELNINPKLELQVLQIAKREEKAIYN